jgi:molecular chaperone GrpE (heat shock protein)
MIEQDSSQQNLTDKEILNDKNEPIPENVDTNLPTQDHGDPRVPEGFTMPDAEPDAIPAPNSEHGSALSRKISVTEEKILEQIQKLQHELAESVQREEILIQLVNEQNRLFKTRFSQDEQKEKLIDKMHEELQKLKADLYKNLVRPVLLDVIHIRDNMHRMEADLNKKYPEGMVPIKTFSEYSVDLADLLEEHGVEIFEEKTGAPFIPVKQKVINRLVTNEEDRSGIIARSISSGYIYNGQVISPQRVDVYYFEESKIQTSDPSNETTQSK